MQTGRWTARLTNPDGQTNKLTELIILPLALAGEVINTIFGMTAWVVTMFMTNL